MHAGKALLPIPTAQIIHEALKKINTHTRLKTDFNWIKQVHNKEQRVA